MSESKSSLDRFREKYGAEAVNAVVRYRPRDAEEFIGWRDRLDPQYTRLWLDYSYGGLFIRGIVDDRTRLLVAIGQLVVLDEMAELEEYLRTALDLGVPPREILEVVLQATVYSGYLKVTRAARIFERVMNELGRMGEIASTQLPFEGSDPDATLEDERPEWGIPPSHLSRREALLAKYGWRGISAGLRLQPSHHGKRVEQLDRYDPHYLKLWEDFIYAGMYRRRVLDDKTRVLAMIGECVAVDEQIQTENHIRGALGLGAAPREILELLLHSTVYVGMPRALKGMDTLERILVQQGRLSELDDTAPPIPGDDPVVD
ncbi:MAG: carboxymuconolactone decarboxylase family protein [Chloroflexi bacterium]|nr:carboxymuconolactone decarboxylase family protein [Chloroflexota bacterium]